MLDCDWTLILSIHVSIVRSKVFIGSTKKYYGNFQGLQFKVLDFRDYENVYLLKYIQLKDYQTYLIFYYVSGFHFILKT